MEKKSIKVILPAFEVDWINSFSQKQNPSDCHYALCILSDLYLALDFALYNK